MYTQKVMDHFSNPRNFGQLENPSAVGEVGNPTCGDVMKLYLAIEKNEQGEEFIADLKFETMGCGAAIATSSMITELAKGKTLEEALAIDHQTITNELGELPPSKIHCSVLADDALAEAIYNYKKEQGQEISQDLQKTHERVQRQVLH